MYLNEKSEKVECEFHFTPFLPCEPNFFFFFSSTGESSLSFLRKCNKSLSCLHSCSCIATLTLVKNLSDLGKCVLNVHLVFILSAIIIFNYVSDFKCLPTVVTYLREWFCYESSVFYEYWRKYNDFIFTNFFSFD